MSRDCPICTDRQPKGPTGELLAWARRVGADEVWQALRAVAPELVGQVHLAMIKARSMR